MMTVVTTTTTTATTTIIAMLMISGTSNIVEADEMMSNRLTRPPCWSDPGGLLVTTKRSLSSILESTSKTKVSKV